MRLAHPRSLTVAIGVSPHGRGLDSGGGGKDGKWGQLNKRYRAQLWMQGPRITLKCVCTAEPSDSISNHNGGQDESRSNHIRQRIKEHIRAVENNGVRYNRVLPYPPMALQLTRFSGEEAAWPPTLPPGVVRGVRRHVRGKVVAIKLPNVWLQLPRGFPAAYFGGAERAVQGLSQVPE